MQKQSMGNDTKTSGSTSILRRRAEARLDECRKKRSFHLGAPNIEEDTLRMLHELQVHQIELELQNEEIKKARDKVELLLEKYTNLFDFAPVGYFTLDQQGRITEANLTGAGMLGVERALLTNRRMQCFVAPSFQSIFLKFLQKALTDSGDKVREMMLQKENGAVFWANLHASPAAINSDEWKFCRLTVSDITALKRAEETQISLEAIENTNRELRKEIHKRTAAEKALKGVEQNQGQLLEEARNMQAQLKELSHQIIQAQEEERKRISRELHDDITQTLVGIHVQLESLAREVMVNPKGLKKKFARTQRLVENAVNIVHRFAQELRPPLLDDLGLIASVHSLMKDFTKRTGLRVKFTAFAGLELLSSTRCTVLYRVVQSALTNVAQHAHASLVKVSIQKIADTVLMEITDNGKSFKTEEMLRAKGNKHLGLLGMRERVEMVGGILQIEANPGKGTTIKVRIPFNGNHIPAATN